MSPMLVASFTVCANAAWPEAQASSRVISQRRGVVIVCSPPGGWCGSRPGRRAGRAGQLARRLQLALQRCLGAAGGGGALELALGQPDVDVAEVLMGHRVVGVV